MDKAKTIAAIRQRFERAKEDLETARLDLSGEKWRAAAIRAYYAAFHVASAALLWRGEERAKHSGVQSSFGELFIKTGEIEPEYGKIYVKARRLREASEYEFEGEPLKGTDARRIVADAERFVTRIEKYLREAGAIREKPASEKEKK